MTETRIRLGLLGCGTVGRGVARLIKENQKDIQRRVGAPVEIHRILVRDKSSDRGPDVDASRVTTRAEAILDDPYVDIVVELMGGMDPTLQYVNNALQQNRHVVTANKALIATHGNALFATAQECGVALRFEAAVAGGIPVIRSLREGLASDRVQRIVAILNGTSNFILTQMSTTGTPYANALGNAQAAGYAEADPTLDVGGFDAAQKLTILSGLAFGTPLDGGKNVHTEGITALAPQDFAHADSLGYAIKPLAIAQQDGDKVHARVHPTLIPKTSLMASVDDVFNAVHITSDGLGPSLLYGAGAGMMPTAVSVVSDVIESARALVHEGSDSAGAQIPPTENMSFAHPGDFECQHYLRFTVVDQPGVLATLSKVLGDHTISIASMFQTEQASDDTPVEIVVCTHQAQTPNVHLAVQSINQLSIVRQPTVVIRMDNDL